MTLISDAEATARALINSVGMLLDTCTVKAPAAGSADGFGGETDTLTTVATEVRCNYQAVRDNPLTVQGGAAIGTGRFKLFLELGDADLQSIGPGWQIIVDARGDKSALTFEDPRRMDESIRILLTVSAKLKQ